MSSIIGRISELFDLDKGSNIGKTFQENVDCMECPEGLGQNVHIPRNIWDDIVAFRNQFMPKECALYLIMEKDDVGYIIKDYAVPRQIVGTANVDIIDIGPSEIIGHIHSHGTFNAFFSGVDRAHFNYPVHITIGANTWRLGVGSTYGGRYDVEVQRIDGLSAVCVIRSITTCGRIIQRSGKMVVPPKPIIDIIKSVPKSVPRKKKIVKIPVQEMKARGIILANENQII